MASRIWGTSSFAGKPGAVIGASIDAPGGAPSQQHLRAVLACLDVPTLGRREVFVQFSDDGPIDAEGSVSSVDMQKFLQGFVGRYVAWVRKHRP